MNPSDNEFSSRVRLSVTAFLGAVVAIAATVFVLEVHTIPALRMEHDRLVSTLPAYLAAANQKALASGDLASLRSTLDQIMAGSQGSGLKYVVIQDADGRIMADAYAPELARAEKDQVMHDLRTSYGRSGKSHALQKEQSYFEQQKQEALTGSESSAAPPPAQDAASGPLPLINDRVSWQFPSFDPPLIDYTVPITTGTISFGGVRIGVSDEVTPLIRTLRTIAYGGSVAALILSQVFAIFISAGFDARIAEVATGAVDTVRAELEQRIKQLELEQTRKEEENPISPAEFLSLLDFARKISGSLDYNEVLTISIHACLQVMSIRDVSIFVLDPAANELVGRIGHDENGFMDETEMAKIRVPIGKGDIGTAAEFGTTTTIDSPRPGAAVVSALVAHGRTIGVILTRNKLNGRPFVKKDQTMLRIFSGLLANAMENTAIFHHLNAQQQQPA